jgi:hypothetical protein
MAPASSTGLCDAAVPKGLRHHHPDDHDECRDADHRREFRLERSTGARHLGVGKRHRRRFALGSSLRIAR